MDTLSRIRNELQGKGELSRIIKNFKVRKEQIEMAETVFSSLRTGVSAIIEAGTGVGKSFAYLLPAALWTRERGKRVVVSTYTRLLQNQLIQKDLPVISEITGVSYDVAYGSDNYFCIKRWKSSTGIFGSSLREREIEEIEKNNGILINFEDANRKISLFGRRPEICNFKDCRFYDDCFYYRAKKNWGKADILVVNHALLLTHCASDYSLLPEPDFIIIDESHRMEDSAISVFGDEVKTSSFISFMDFLQRTYGLREIRDYRRLSHIKHLTEYLKNYFIKTFSKIELKLLNKRRVKNFEVKILKDEVLEVTGELIQELSSLSNKCGEDVRDLIVERIKTLTYYTTFFEKFDMGEYNFVKWIEKSGNRIIFYSKPVEVSEILRERLFSKYKRFLLTSATLTVAESFNFIRERLGFPSHVIERIINSPFDYKNRVLLYVSRDMPMPQHELYIKGLALKIKEILDITGGRALVLFTSYETMNKVYEEMGGHFLKQGDKERHILLEEFRRDKKSVLFATSSFWEGVDVPGDSLLCVIITKLPFEVPDDPRFEEIVKRLASSGKNPFIHYQIPLAVMRLKQGVGRLMRKETDYGAICILDSRMVKKKYGTLFLKSLSHIPITDSLRNLRLFFERYGI